MLNFILQALVSAFKSHQALTLENAALRHQINVLQRNCTRPALKWRDRAFWDVLSSIWPNWRNALYIVQPETVVRWHRLGFRFYWRWRAVTGSMGARITREVRELIGICRQPIPYGCTRIHGELLKLGIDVASRLSPGT